MPFEQSKFEKQEPKFINKEETELERKQRLGKEAEWGIALPLLKEMQKGGLFAQVDHTSKEVDEKRRVDFVCKLGDGCHLGFQFSTSESKRIWAEKIDAMIGDQKGKPYEELKDIHPRAEILSRRERLERVPIIPLPINWEIVSNAYKRFEGSGKKGAPFDFLPQKKEVAKEVFGQALEGLRIFSSDKKLAQRFPDLPVIAKQRYETLNKAYANFIQEKK